MKMLSILKINIKIISIILPIFLLLSCTGTRSGIESGVLDTFDDDRIHIKPKTRLAGSPSGYVDQIQIPEMKIEIDLNNAYPTRDTFLVGPYIPVATEKKKNPDSKLFYRYYAISITLLPSISGYIFDPTKVTLMVDGEIYEPLLEKKDVYGSDMKVSPFVVITKIDKLGKYDFESYYTNKEIELIYDKYRFSITYELSEKPLPNQNIKVDMSKALLNNNISLPPLIIEFKERKFINWLS